MCGRFKLSRAGKERIAREFQIADGLADIDYADEIECAPGSIQPIIRGNGAADRDVTPMRWGFTLPNKLPARLIFNIRSEGVAESSFWKSRLATRCIVPAEAFYEWKRVGKRSGPKFEVTVHGRALFGLAGLWLRWTNPKTKEVEKTFSIFTSEPNALMRAIHDRQPVILDPGEYEEWLAPNERPPVHLLRIFPEEKMAAAEVVTQRSPVTGNLFG